MAFDVGHVLLERDAELAVIAAAIADAAQGDGRVVIVEGPAGIGKTRLLAALRDAAGRAGMRCLAARGNVMERAFAFGVIRQLFEPVAAAADPEARAELFAGSAGLARHLVEGGADEAGAGISLFAACHGLYWLAANVAAAHPTTVIVDDLHWVDPPSLAALDYIARRLDGVSLLLGVASRPEEPGFDRAWLDGIVREPGARLVVPRALSPAATADVVRAGLTRDAAPAFCAACHDVTQGNPLLVTELVAALRSEGVAGTDRDIGLVARIGPEAVARAVRVRLAQLSPDARALAEAASVLGDGASVADAASLAGTSPEAGTAAAQELIGVGLVRNAHDLAFVHPVVREAVRQSQGPHRLRDAHARAARLLAAADRPPEEVAAQLLECAPAGDAAAVDTLLAAARRAAADGGLEVAARLLRRALAEPPPPAARARVLAELGGIEQVLNGPLAIEHLRAALELADDAQARARVALGLGRALYFVGDVAGAQAVFSRALDERGDSSSAARSLQTGLVVLGLFEPSLIALARERLGDIDTVSEPRDIDERILLAYGAYDAARSGGDRERLLRTVAPLLDDPSIVTDESQGAWAALGALLWSADRLDEAARLADHLTRFGESSGSVFLAASGLVLTGNVLHRRGALAEAETYLAAGIETAVDHGFLTVSNWAGAQHAMVLVERGDLAAADGVLRNLGLDGPLPDSVHLYEARLAHARVQLGRGRMHDAIDALQAVGAAWDAIGACNPDMAPWRGHLAEALRLGGDREAAEKVSARQLELARAWGAGRLIAQALRVHGLCVTGAAGIAFLEEAVAVARGAPGRLQLAMALVELGAAERRANRRSAARARLEEGLALAQDCGAAGLEERARHELLAAGARPRRAQVRGRDALTPSELRVAEMALTGVTNREIAQRLFVTQKTVESHLGRVFRKLEIESRSQLAQALGARAQTGAATAGGR